MQERVYEKRVNDVDELCRRLCWVCGTALERHRQSDRSVACATHHLCTSQKESFWAPDVNRLELTVSTVTWHLSQFWTEYDLVVYLHT